MSKKTITSVITLVSKNRECYVLHYEKITDLFKKYNIKILKTNKLSKLVKDFYVNIDINTFVKIKLYFKSNTLKGSDVCIQENSYRKKKVIACDMDKTAICIESIDLIGEKILKNSLISELTEKAMSGGVNFNSSITERTKILKGISVNEIKKIIKHVKLTKNVETVIKTMNKYGCHTMLISGGYDIIANRIGKKIGFKEIISNKPISQNGTLTGELKGNIVDGKGKLNYFKSSIKTHSAKNSQTLAIGDGQNDIDMIKFASLGIAWKGFPKVNKVADALANYSFKSILYFQGYNDKEIVN
ncbi:MAG: Phosphoserine phosphatase [Alphaproteobacteria bacterium MarineAlpha9_Bin4]|nr:phosphoserine phosphatase SerB [Pelagibacterales bacterium]PPR25976.1 MAG: Phosphoserine phosphatase [Alphaproteobacteria bacterium MarineAlpha9_Bin4]|tara:strand:- start:183 stop:1085 length:903 start_codon:yes stop_codon:yes gene_type:complete